MVLEQLRLKSPIRRIALLVSLLLACGTLAWAANNHGKPDAQQEMQSWFGDMLVPTVFSGCTPAVPGASLTLAAFACTGYVEGSTGDLVYVTQPAATITLANTNGEHWLALCRDLSSTVAGWTRRSGSHYVFQQAASQPATPAGCHIFHQVTVAGSVITAVAKVGNGNPAAAPYATASLPTPPGLRVEAWVTDTIRGKWGYQGAQWYQLAGRMVNIQEFGAIPDDGLDDREAIQAAIDAAATNGAGVWCPSGTYDLTRHPTKSLALEMKTGMIFVGAGIDQCILKLLPDQTRFTRIFSIHTNTETTDVVIRDLTLDGDFANQNDASGHDQQHGIFIGTDTAIVRRFFLTGLKIRKMGGDGIALYGGVGTMEAIITNNHIEDTDRSGIAGLGNGPRRLIIANNQLLNFANGSCIDFEPTIAGNGPADIIVAGNVMVSGITTGPTVTLAGSDASNRAAGVIFAHNSVSDGSVQIAWADDVTISGNTIDLGSNTQTALLLQRTINQATVVSNIIRGATATSAGIRVVGTGTEVANNVIIQANRVASYGTGVELATCTECIVSDNVLMGSGTATTRGILVNANLVDITNITLRGNIIQNFNTTCILITRTAALTITGLVIADNICDDTQGPATQTVGIAFGASAELFVTHALIGGNVFREDITTAFSSLGSLAYLLTGVRGGVGVWSVSATPEAALTAPIGSQALRRDGGANTTLYIKESGTGNTGWVAK